MAINLRNHLPAVGFKTLNRIVCEPAFNFTIDRDAVVIVEGNQFAQTQCTGQRAGFVGDTFHHAAVAQEHVGVVVNDFVAFTVELTCQNFLCQCHTDAVGDALTQWTRGGFDARCVTVLRVTRSFGVQLTEVFQIVDRQIVTAEVQQGINQHRAVTVRQNKTVAVGPFRILRVVFQIVVPENFGDVCHAHRGAWVS